MFCLKVSLIELVQVSSNLKCRTNVMVVVMVMVMLLYAKCNQEWRVVQNNSNPKHLPSKRREWQTPKIIKHLCC